MSCKAIFLFVYVLANACPATAAVDSRMATRLR
jgi:hypothetical protein